MKFSKKICQFCGDEFMPTSGRQKFCTKLHERKCPVCGNTYVEANTHNLTKPPHACSPKCRGVLESRTKASMQSKPKQLEVACKNYEPFLEFSLMSQLKFKAAACSQIEESLKLRGIKYMMFMHIDDISYEFHLIDYHVLIILAEYGYDQYRNQRKIKVASSHGFKCIVIYPWDNIDLVLAKLQPKTIINFGDCQIYRLHADSTKQFLNSFDFQGSCRGQLVKLGLIYNNRIVQVMTFGKARRSKQHCVEILRMCAHPEYHIVNGFKALFNYALTFYALEGIVAYSDVAKYGTSKYTECSLKLLRVTPPQEIWSKGTKYVTANLLRSHGYDQLFGTNYGKGTSNDQLMLENGWLPVYDCGQKVFEFRKS